jgi:hypothetical protein
VLTDNIHNPQDGNREQQTPYPPEPYQEEQCLHTDTAFNFAIWMAIEVTTNTTIMHDCCGQYLEMWGEMLVMAVGVTV